MPAADNQPRDHIGPYRIVGRVGAGGMGEVFKAWDPRLERDVAIKLLHPEAAGDAARQQRLLAEGRAASALNHPNILRVYDADVDGDSYYLVSEWLEGKSLRDELSRGPLPAKRLLDLAVQIADGLAAAHALGIVHRDIKPENVMLARDGTARIVDFGLARIDPHAPSRAHAAAHATTVTLEGGVSGTPAYMSPEQARGQLGDFRTDQFSFGAMLYEMATGKHAFRRDSMADTLSAVLHDEPKSIATLNPRTPVPLIWIVEQCLAKDPTERYAATDDLARELRRVRERLREATGELTAVASGRAPARNIAVAVLSTAVIAAVIGILTGNATTPTADLRFTPLASSAGYEGTPVWSPDGQSLAWVAEVNGVLQVFMRRLNDAVASQVTRGRFDAEEPFWAPDSRTLYFISAAGDGSGLWTVGAAGGRPELLIENVNHAAIDPAGTRFALYRNDSTVHQRLWWASATGDNLVQETRGRFGVRGFGLGGQLRFRPDGQFLLAWIFNDRAGGEPTTSSYFLVSTNQQGPITEVLTSIPSTANLPPASWLPDNRHVVVGVADPSGARHLWFADTASDWRKRLTSTHTNETWPVASPDGRRIAYASEEVDFDLIGISSDGRVRTPTLATARNEMDPAWSPKGDQYGYVTDRNGGMEIWLRSRDGQWERPLVTAALFTGETQTLGALAFSPDGRTLAFQRRGFDQATIWLIPASGGTPVQLVTGDNVYSFHDAPTWSPDSEWIAISRSNGPEFSLAKVRVGTKEVISLVADRVVPFSRAAWSPDGRHIAVETFDGLVNITADGGSADVVLNEPLLAHTWAADSRKITALVESELIGHISLIEIDTVTRNVTIVNPDLGTIPVANQPIRGFSFVPQQGFLTSFASARSDIWLLEGFEAPTSPLLRWFRR